MRTVALLARRLQVLGQPLADGGFVGTERRGGALGRLSFRRDRRRQGLTHRAAVHVVAIGQGRTLSPSCRSSLRIFSNGSTLDISFSLLRRLVDHGG